MVTHNKIAAEDYPFQDLGLKNIKGEKWKDIPGLEMYFQVSNFGRVKRLEYEMRYSDGRVYRKEKKVIKPVVMKIHNRFMDDNVLYLRTTVTLHKQKHNFAVARLVYYCFKKSFPLDDKTVVILARDCNGLNVRPANLVMTSLSGKQKRIFELNRRPALVVDEMARQKGIVNSRLTNSKQVTQYNKKGLKMRTYESAAEASKMTGIGQSGITNNARGVEYTSGGFIWRYGNAKAIDLSPLTEKKAQHESVNKEAFGKKVTQYTLDGLRVATFQTINDAAKAAGIKRGEITLMINQKRGSAGGFYWKAGYGRARIDLSNHLHGRAITAHKRQRRVKQLTRDGKYIRTYESIQKAADNIGISGSTISGVLSGRHKTAAGFKWLYAF